MLKRLTIAILLVCALLLAQQSPVQACALSMSAIQKKDCPACCATMKSCVLPQQNPTQSTTAASVELAPVAMLAPALVILSRDLPTPRFSASCLAGPALNQLRLRPAVLCTFLI